VRINGDRALSFAASGLGSDVMALISPGSTPRWVWIAVVALALCVVGYV
jgi:hypothetical protein